MPIPIELNRRLRHAWRGCAQARRRARRPTSAACLCLVLLTLAGCAAPQPDVLAFHSQPFDSGVIAAVRARVPVGAEENLRAETLSVGEGFSAHLLQFRTGEERHIHRFHDLTFIVHRGEGRVFVDDIGRLAMPGDVFHIPRNTPHYCVNLGDEPLIAVLVFTPPFDFKDTVPLPRERASYER